MVRPPALYKKFFLDPGDERVDLFRELRAEYGIGNALYPGAFVHFAPSLVITRTVYVDSDKRAKRVFGDPLSRVYIADRKEYPEEPEVVFHESDYGGDFGEEPGSFDLLISQYAGFVSTACKKYLKIGGVLVANDSHGDAGMASIDPDFEFVAVVDQRGDKFSLKDAGLDQYFVPKRAILVTAEHLRETGRGVAYTKKATAYIFRRTA